MKAAWCPARVFVVLLSAGALALAAYFVEGGPEGSGLSAFSASAAVLVTILGLRRFGRCLSCSRASVGATRSMAVDLIPSASLVRRKGARR